MSDLLKSQIQQLKEDNPRLNGMPDEHVFSLVCFSHFFNDGKYSMNIYDENFTDGTDDGGIDMVYADNGNKDFILIQSKNEESLQNKQDVVDALIKMALTVKKFEENNYNHFSDTLKRKFINTKDDLDNSGYNFSLYYFTSAKISRDRLRSIESLISSSDDLSRFNCHIYATEEIENAIKYNLDPPPHVEEAKVKYFKDHNILKHSEYGVILNVSAQSLKKLYNQHYMNGLFGQNFRFFIKNKKIDDAVKVSINNMRDEFWFLNNGIIIGCEDYHLDGNVLKLYNFSIINGCQTTTLLGNNLDGDDDFPISCKIVKPKENSDKNFIPNIAEASNSQKPIRDRDLKSNRDEQKRLQRMMKENSPEVFIEIKRGETLYTPAKGRQLKSWQKKQTNEYLGQIILGSIYQRPGTARSSKSNIFGVKKDYDSIFLRSVDKILYVDLLRIHQYYLDYVTSDSFRPSDDHDYQVATYGKFLIPAILVFLVKVLREKVNYEKCVPATMEEFKDSVKDDNLEENLFKVGQNLPDDYKTILNSLFFEIIKEVSQNYQSRAENLKKSVTNYFKTDTNYHDKILSWIVDKKLKDDYYREKLLPKLREIFID